MIAGVLFTIALVILVICLIVLGVCWLFDCETVEDRVQREQAQAEARIDADHDAALRAMNDAAGESWRNVAE